MNNIQVKTYSKTIQSFLMKTKKNIKKTLAKETNT